jgi:cytochrome c
MRYAVARRGWGVGCGMLISTVATGVAVEAAFVTKRQQDESWSRAMTLTGGDPAVGRELLRTYGCNSCHTIPGVPGSATVGPPLDKMALRTYIAGVMSNTPENMIRWLKDPPAIDPMTAMPVTRIDDAGARAVAAYLYTLE